jgi:uncharacterized OsmC-like protein
VEIKQWRVAQLPENSFHHEEVFKMSLNNFNTKAAGKFMEEVKENPEAAKKKKRVQGEWVFEEGRPQFKAKLEFKEGEQIVEADFAPFMGGRGLAPDPIQYCLFGMASCYAGTFMAIASMEGVELQKLSISVENRVDLGKTLGLSENPIAEGVEVTFQIRSHAPREKIEAIENLARERCPGVYCLTHPIELKTRVEMA